MTNVLLFCIFIALVAIWLAMPARTFSEQIYLRAVRALERIASALEDGKKPS